MGVVEVVVAVVVVVVLLVWLVATYNRLVRIRNRNQEAWAGIDVQLTRRAELVPNLVETVKGYADFEASTLEEVVRARTALTNASGPAEAGRADSMLEGALRQLFAVAEAHPDLKASTNFLQLQDQLSSLEDDIVFARRYYNATVEELASAIQTFPTLLVARPMGFEEAEYFRADDGHRDVPEVSFES